MATARRRKAKAARAAAAEAMKKDRKNAYDAMVTADKESRQAEAEAKEATTTAAAKAEESMQAVGMAMAKAEEAAVIASVKAEEAEKAREAYREVCRQVDAAAEWAQCEEELFAARFRRYWNQLVARPGVTFHQTTSIPAMRYTHPAPHDRPKAMDTLQITSVKIAAVDDCLQWPLQVYGIIAARDVLDHKRNILFHRRRGDCQIITQEDPYLALTGPSRAIAVSRDLSYIEVSLKVKGASRTRSEDGDLSDLVLSYGTGLCLAGIYPSRLSTLELESSHINRSVEATVRIKITHGSWPDGLRGAFTAGMSSNNGLEVELLNTRDGRALPVDSEGVVKLQRRVISVYIEGMLKVSVVACSVDEERGFIEKAEAVFEAKRQCVSVMEINFGSCSMQITVAWSCFRHE
ncbi:uncharacterized protein LOC123418187 [Hordeum vulgare subsp. vulgare]|uniref:uncharacterized protein LOC123407954 n=1 Tax=Hordeum vulgare subsp. vulgare TaxID=112509 RepID=UPI001D1A4A2D|nr:uncharacterized protein LOC123407954 [Hordeum vulgare subsp. vulgare]XP_044957136.1 uncharacterized protein LOC123407955 [Hordeum vulgare subsp. vulgare]XP_044957137.1 uncharacterized protein LOC123407956 [Hordeum vulgare subsp. vulgare]XP_044957138.1 uncharacterized protein LOC123407957 [Hordeum vulgare subsp. vulgare]XP_044962883.1 uncharacterized protein LOC123418181 [Hordeum vulgare subsp. vulgare]XP_044962886.1 uncharacterized protein LOC123418183 [Hordeum vulgare subsp. vulgare]XP_04